MSLVQVGVAALAATWIVAVAEPPEYRLVVNAGNPATSVTRSEAGRMFLKKVVSWPNGWTVTAVDQERGSAVRPVFRRDIHQKDADAIAAHWQTAVFSGRDVPPPIARSDAEVLAFVRANPGAIGYVSGTSAVEGVKVLTVR